MGSCCSMEAGEKYTVADLLTIVLHTARGLEDWNGFVEDAVAAAAPDVPGIDAAIASQSLPRIVVTLTRAGVHPDDVTGVEKTVLYELAKRAVNDDLRCRVGKLATLAARVQVPCSDGTPKYVVWSRIRSRLRAGWTVRVDPTHISSDRWRQLETKLGVKCNTNHWDAIARYMFVTDVELLLGPKPLIEIDAPDHAPDNAPFPSATAAAVVSARNGGAVTRSVLTQPLTRADLSTCISRVFDCAHCGSPFLLPQNKTIHEAHCRSRVAFPCPDCEKTLYSERSLRSHKFWCRSNRHGARYMPDPVAWCEHCGLKTTEGNLHGGRNSGRKSAPSKPHAERCLMNRTRTKVAEKTPEVHEFIHRTCASMRHVVPDTAENQYTDVMRGHILLCPWDVEVVRAWCDMEWGRAGEPFLCHLLFRNIEQAATTGFTDQAALEHFLRFFRPPDGSGDLQWYHALDAALRNKGAGLDRWLRADLPPEDDRSHLPFFYY